MFLDGVGAPPPPDSMAGALSNLERVGRRGIQGNLWRLLETADLEPRTAGELQARMVAAGHTVTVEDVEADLALLETLGQVEAEGDRWKVGKVVKLRSEGPSSVHQHVKTGIELLLDDVLPAVASHKGALITAEGWVSEAGRHQLQTVFRLEVEKMLADLLAEHSGEHRIVVVVGTAI